MKEGLFCDFPMKDGPEAGLDGRESADLAIADLQFNDRGLIPCIVQDAESGLVLMLAWMDPTAVERTLLEKTTWFWSRSRNCYWHKGETSGNTQELVDLRYDCDGDALVALVRPKGPACHTGAESCFYRSLVKNG